jgi:hypothetical protein
MIEYLKILKRDHGIIVTDKKDIEFIQKNFNVTLTKDNYIESNNTAIGIIVKVIGVFRYNEILSYSDRNYKEEIVKGFKLDCYLVTDNKGNYRSTFYGGEISDINKIYIDSAEPSTEEEWLKQFTYEDKEITDLFNIINDSEKLLKNG